MSVSLECSYCEASLQLDLNTATLELKRKPMQNISKLDKLICNFDRALRSLSPNTQQTLKASPADKVAENQLSEEERRISSGLMRVNHSGEVCAQALYQGQALTAKLPNVQQEMEKAADEEIDHLAWCEQRLSDLNSNTSILNPFWYAMSFSIGATAGLIGDKISLGFVAATEDQVSKHLEDHLSNIPTKDNKSKEIVQQMLEDERRHAQTARDAGAAEFPELIKNTMSLTSKAMTKLSYRI